MRRATMLLALVTALVLSVAAAAGAAWQAGSAANSKGRAAAVTMPAGEQPTANATGDSVTVGWSPTTSPSADSYTIRVYDASTDTERTPIGGDCADVPASPTPSCTEASVPAGTWRYTVTPKLQAWTGAESPESDPVTVPGP
jgi:hypothetical protein